ncbi:unnamed protein product [Urochloa decumbens]|uniref:Secreted protein n=1 Tax=Urochloa decumbens TaxID=240449 RepID=A0ABC9DGA5_9POAL
MAWRGGASCFLLVTVHGRSAFSFSAAASRLCMAAPLLVAPHCRVPTFAFAKAIGAELMEEECGGTGCLVPRHGALMARACRCRPDARPGLEGPDNFDIEINSNLADQCCAFV